MKKVLLVTNHFSYSDGVAMSLINFTNAFANEYEFTIAPLFRIDREFAKHLDSRIKVKRIFGFYFKGLTWMLSKLPQWLLYKIIIKDKYDVEIAYQGGEPTMLIAASVNKNSKKICWMHGYDEDMIYRKSYIQYDYVVCVAKYGADKLEKELSTLTSIRCCYNIMDSDAIIEKSKEFLDIHKNFPFTMVSVSRLSPEKGFLRLLKCLKRLVDNGYVFNYWLIGGGKEDEMLINYINANGLKKYVTMFGLQNNPYKYIVRSDLYICSSYSEGYSTSCAEAALLGVPVISSKVGGAEEIIQLSECGIVVESDDESLYNGLKNVLDTPEIIITWKQKLEQTKTNFSFLAKKQQAKVVLNEIF